MVIPSGPLAAMACLKGEGELRGTVKFFPVNCGTLIAAEVSGLPDNENGFFWLHIHEGQAFADSLEAHPRHAGDLPPLRSEDGRAFLAVRTGRINVWEVIGKTVAIHRQAEDRRSRPVEEAGERIAWGVIKMC